MIKAENPILKGFYPDPSICRAGEDFYLVNSSFAYFPGIPLFHSRDLAHWEQIGNVLDRPEQLPLENCRISRGIFAPTIRYHEGYFYVITTNVDNGGNFIVKSSNPQGPWSDPYYLGDGAEGIDPSLFFDTDGTCYYVGTRPNSKKVRYNGDWEIWIQELDLEEMKLVGSSRKIWKGSAHNAIWPEGPHLYKIGEYYYLIHAEGGTSTEHSIVAARSRSLEEKFEGCPANPVFTHRHLGRNYPVTCAGHGDLFDDGKGNWYMVMLASRMNGGFSSMGRETFLAKVEWQNDWPVINPGIGRLEEAVELPNKEYRFPKETGNTDIFHFWGEKLDSRLISVCGQSEEMYSLKARPGFLRLFTRKEQAKDNSMFSYIGSRQKSYSFEASARMEFQPDIEGEAAGILLYQNDKNHLKMELTKKQGKTCFCITEVIQGEENLLSETPVGNGPIEITFRAHNQRGEVFLNENEHAEQMAKDIGLEPYTTEAAGGFVGCTIGMYTSSYGQETSSWADFSWFFVK